MIKKYKEVKLLAISRAEFETGQFKKRVYQRTEHPVFRLLSKNPTLAFTVTEIAKQTRMKEETIRSMLRELIADGLVVHKTPYWAVAKRKKL